LCSFSIDGNKGEEKYLNQFLRWKTNSNDNIFNGNNSDISWDKNNNVYITGNYEWKNNYGYLLKIKPDLTPAWFRSYNILPDNKPSNGWVQNFPYTITRTSDKGFLLTGEYNSTPSQLFPKGTQQGMVIKVDSLGCLEGGCDLKDGIPQWKAPNAGIGLKVYPNPASEKIFIRYNVPNSETIKLRLRISDLTGRNIISKELHNRKGYTEVNTQELNAGVYLIELIDNGVVIKAAKEIITK
jgi:hypothetical protein